MNLSLNQLKGIGPKREQSLNEAGIYSILDLVYFFPRRYDRIQIGESAEKWEEGTIVQSHGVVTKIQQYQPRRGMNIIKISLQTAEELVSLFWFNQPFLKKRFQIDAELAFQGKLSLKAGAWSISHPKILSLENNISFDAGQSLVPVYISSLQNHWLQSIINQAIESFTWEEIFPKDFLKSKKFLARQEALSEIHKPSTSEKLEAARYRFAYEGLLFLQTVLLEKRHRNRSEINVGIHHAKTAKSGIVAGMIKDLPYALTKGQEKSWREIQKDMEDKRPMQRLLQGDVGSGKTIIAALSLAKTVENAFQGAFMAPTEILANQHYENLSQIFSGSSVKVELLTQSVPTKEKKRILEELKKGTTNIIIGTHALFQESVEFSQLGLVVTDEQHRFGVNQRAALYSKGHSPDMLVMTATPIPRTLALTFYGDLDISTIDTMPVGRKDIRTFVRSDESRGKVYQFAYDQIQSGRQVYVVAPAIEENPEFAMKSAYDLHREIQELWGDSIKVEVLHGRLSGSEKKEIMENFINQKTQLLVATTVIEVGIHVANATVMIVENAERFGLSQLHQLRGRVGRGSHSSYCILLSSSQGNKRLQAMEKISDGFLLAEEDLKLRGSGEFFGEKQHGIPDLKIADFLLEPAILNETRNLAIEILDDPKKWDLFLQEMYLRFSHWLGQINQH